MHLPCEPSLAYSQQPAPLSSAKPKTTKTNTNTKIIGKSDQTSTSNPAGPDLGKMLSTKAKPCLSLAALFQAVVVSYYFLYQALVLFCAHP